jgi:hypothetical protein
MKKNSIENYVYFGLDSIDETRMVEVNLKNLLLIYKTIGELISFFHQEGHYKTIEDVREYIGDKKSGMLAILCKINYQDYENLLPQEVKDILESDDFYSPIKQYYKTR